MVCLHLVGPWTCIDLPSPSKVLQSDNLPAVISGESTLRFPITYPLSYPFLSGMRTVCGLMSTLIGSVASTNRELPSQTPITVTPSSAAAISLRLSQPGLVPAVITSLLGILVGFRLLL